MRTDLRLAADLGRTRSQLAESEADCPLGVEADAVVGDDKSGDILVKRQDHAGRAGPGVLADVGQSLLDRTQQDDFGVVGEGDGVALHLEVRGEAEARAEVVARPTYSVGERSPLKCRRY